MAREMVVSIWCDLCQHLDDARVEAEEMVPVTVGGGKPRVLALCPQHRAEFFDRFVETLTDLGVTAESLQSQSSGEGRVPCPICGKESKNRNSLSAHMRNMHEVSLRQYNSEHATGAPPPGGGEGQVAVCPECGREYRTPQNPRPRHALSVHLSRKHGITAAQRKAAS